MESRQSGRARRRAAAQSRPPPVTVQGASRGGGSDSDETPMRALLRPHRYDRERCSNKGRRRRRRHGRPHTRCSRRRLESEGRAAAERQA